MATVKNRHMYLPDQVVFREGEHGNSIYIVEKGKVEIWRGQPDARVVLGFITAGGVFGEMAIFDDGPRMANATAAEESVLIRIPADRVRSAIKRADPIVERLIRVMLESARNMAEQLEAVCLEKAGVIPRAMVRFPVVRVIGDEHQTSTKAGPKAATATPDASPPGTVTPGTAS